MSQFFKILKADPLGQPWTPNIAGAKPIQNYWCQVEGLDKDVSIGKQVRDDGASALHAGQHVYGDLLYAKSQKGTEYWKFKSAQVPEDVQRPADSPAQSIAQQATGTIAQGVAQGVDMSAVMPAWFQPWANVLLDIYKDVKLLKGDVLLETAEPAKEDPKLELTGDPLDEITQKTLDDIFTPPEVPEDK